MGDSRIRAGVDFDRPGVQHGHLDAPYSRDGSAWGSLLIPITCVVNGAGPTVLLTGGNHGDEYEGQVALAKLCRAIDPAQVRGRIVIVPALNYPAARAGTRTSPIDGGNLNRSFPGRRDGTMTQMIAHYVDSVLLPMADVVVDLHSGGTSLEFLPSAIMHRLADRQQSARTFAALKAFGAPVGLVLEELDTAGLLDTAAEDKGKVFLSTELCGGGRLDFEGLAIAERGIRNVLIEVGALRGEIERRPTRLLDTDGPGRFLKAPEAGVCEYLAPLGAAVERGQPLARIHFLDRPSREAVVLTAGAGGVLWGRRPLAQCDVGDCLAIVAGELDERSITSEPVRRGGPGVL